MARSELWISSNREPHHAVMRVMISGHVFPVFILPHKLSEVSWKLNCTKLEGMLVKCEVYLHIPTGRSMAVQILPGLSHTWKGQGTINIMNIAKPFLSHGPHYQRLESTRPCTNSDEPTKNPGKSNTADVRPSKRKLDNSTKNLLYPANCLIKNTSDRGRWHRHRFILVCNQTFADSQ